MSDTYIVISIRNDKKLVLTAKVSQEVFDEGFVFDIIDQYAIPGYQIIITTEEVENDRIN